VSSTRLLVLGVLRIFQPTHGYHVRSELLSWGVDDWARINPGSIYNALRTLERSQLVERVDSSQEGNRPARTTYELTRDGEVEFFGLLRSALWSLDEYDPSTLQAGLSFVNWLTRYEVIEAMTSRVALLDARLAELGHHRRHLVDTRSLPFQAVEGGEVHEAVLRGEREWALAFAERVRSGRYLFYPEAGWDEGPGPDGWVLDREPEV
jgi:DNA-binding PadR family transcriptional regulator